MNLSKPFIIFTSASINLALNLIWMFVLKSKEIPVIVIPILLIISRRASAREGDYEMMPVRACVRACVCACVS